MILSTLDRCPIIQPGSRDALICSDTIVVPAQLCPLGATITFELYQTFVTETIGYKKQLVGTCYGGNPFTHEVVYVPTWMYNFFNGNKVEIASITLRPAKTIRIQPLNAEILPYGFTKLQKAFENYNALVCETIIPIRFDDKTIYVEISAVNDTHLFAQIRNSSVYFEFMPVVKRILPWIGVGRRICD